MTIFRPHSSRLVTLLLAGVFALSLGACASFAPSVERRAEAIADTLLSGRDARLAQPSERAALVDAVARQLRSAAVSDDPLLTATLAPRLAAGDTTLSELALSRHLAVLEASREKVLTLLDLATFAALRDLDLARNHLLSATAMDPDHALPWYRLGRVEMLRGDNRAAATAFSMVRALDANADSDQREVGRDALSWLGILAYQAGDMTRASPLLAQAAEAERAAGRMIQSVEASTLLAEVHLTNGDELAAELAFTQALKDSEDLDDPVAIATARAGLGRLALRRGDLTSAAEWLRQAEQGYEQAGDRRRQAWAIDNQVVVARRQGDLERAQSLQLTAIDIHRQLADTATLAQSQMGLALIRLYLGRMDEAERAAEQALALYRSLGPSSRAAHALLLLGSLHLHRGDLKSAEASYREALSLETRRGYEPGIGWATAAVGEALHRQGDLTAAEALYTDALRRMTALNRLSNQAEIHIQLGLLALDRGQPADGEFATAVTMAREVNDRINVAHGLWGRGRAALAEGDGAAALVRLAAAAELCDQLGNRICAASVLVDHARALVETGDTEGGKARLREAIAANRAMVLPLPVARAHRHLGEVALAEGDAIEALRHLHRTVELAERMGARHLASEVRRQIGRISETDETI